MSTPNENGPNTAQLLVIGFAALGAALTVIWFISP